MKKAKYLIMGVIIGIIISSLCIYADDIMITIEKIPLKYVIDGVEAVPPKGEEGFIYNDRTYVPIRFVAESLGKEVGWSENDYTVSVTDKFDKYIIEDDKLYAGKEIAIEKLSNYDEMIKDTGYQNEDVLEVKPIGAYNEYLLLSIIYGNTEKVDGLIYQYNLTDNSYSFVQKYDVGIVGAKMYQVMGDNLIVTFDSKKYIYKADTLELVFEKSTNEISNLITYGDFAYFSLKSDFENKDYKLYKQKFGADKEELYHILEKPFVIKMDNYDLLGGDCIGIYSADAEFIKYLKFE